jgi:Flp pilus assembly protein TadD
MLFEDLGDVASAKLAYRCAIDSGQRRWAPLARVNLGVLLSREGDNDGARALYRQAIDSGDPEAAPQAGMNLG